MGTCNIDHSMQDVIAKLHSQRAFMPEALFDRVAAFLQEEPNQDELNAIFHLLKKYDLASSEEQDHRNHGLIEILNR